MGYSHKWTTWLVLVSLAVSIKKQLLDSPGLDELNEEHSQIGNRTSDMCNVYYTNRYKTHCMRFKKVTVAILHVIAEGKYAHFFYTLQCEERNRTTEALFKPYTATMPVKITFPFLGCINYFCDLAIW